MGHSAEGSPTGPDSIPASTAGAAGFLVLGAEAAAASPWTSRAVSRLAGAKGAQGSRGVRSCHRVVRESGAGFFPLASLAMPMLQLRCQLSRFFSKKSDASLSSFTSSVVSLSSKMAR